MIGIMHLDYAQDYVLENERVRLEPLEEKHWDALEQISKNPEIWTFFDEGGIEKEEFRKYLFDASQHRSKGNQYPFVAFDKRSNKYAGMTRLYAYDSVLKNIKVGHTWIGKDFHNTGLNKACKHCILEFVFDTIFAERVGFGVHEENIQSQRALGSIGIKEEGRLRNFFNRIKSPGRCDLILYGITRQEWKTKLKNKLYGQYKSYLA